MSDKRAMVSMVDAVIFTAIIGLLVVNFIIPHQPSEEHVIDNGSIHDDILSLRFCASPVFPELGNITLSISEMAAIEMCRDGDSTFSDLLNSILKAMLGTGRPWQLTFTQGDYTLNFGLKRLNESNGVIMTERAVTIQSPNIVISRLYVV